MTRNEMLAALNRYAWIQPNGGIGLKPYITVTRSYYSGQLSDWEVLGGKVGHRKSDGRLQWFIEGAEAMALMIEARPMLTSWRKTNADTWFA